VDDLHAVLTARIDELERAAQMSAGANPGEWVDITDGPPLSSNSIIGRALALAAAIERQET
jgi:hypothetical protein